MAIEISDGCFHPLPAPDDVNAHFRVCRLVSSMPARNDRPVMATDPLPASAASW
jgi:hypothetical protein